MTLHQFCNTFLSLRSTFRHHRWRQVCKRFDTVRQLYTLALPVILKLYIKYQLLGRISNATFRPWSSNLTSHYFFVVFSSTILALTVPLLIFRLEYFSLFHAHEVLQEICQVRMSHFPPRVKGIVSDEDLFSRATGNSSCLSYLILSSFFLDFIEMCFFFIFRFLGHLVFHDSWMGLSPSSHFLSRLQ